MPRSPPQPATGADGVGTRRAEQKGQTSCIHVNQGVAVFLEAPPEQPDNQKWRPIASSDESVMTPLPTGELNRIRGETGGVLKALKPGVARLTSTRPPCGSESPSDCPKDQGWDAIIVVSP